MSDTRGTVLTINGGSSSIRFALFSMHPSPQRILRGQIERIGLDGTRLSATSQEGSSLDNREIHATSHRAAAEQLIDWLDENGRGTVVAIGHRVVHGGIHLVNHQRVNDALIEELKRTQPLDLAHLPLEIALIEALGRRLPGTPQVACFDTAFHRDLPRVAQLLPIPRRYTDAGVRRLGFHGLSYSYLVQELQRVAGDRAAQGKVILAHLGSGSSMVAIRDGKPIDTSMAFTPTAGLVMGTRPGDIDPGLLVYLMKTEKLSSEQMDEFLSHECGLRGVSGTTSDMRDLLKSRQTDPRAAQAVDLFCYQARKFIGAYVAALEGLDTLVFSGGIGQHSPAVRQQICSGLSIFNLHIDERQNAEDAAVISTSQSGVIVRVIPTDEEAMIARIVRTVLDRST